MNTELQCEKSDPGVIIRPGPVNMICLILLQLFISQTVGAQSENGIDPSAFLEVDQSKQKPLDADTSLSVTILNKEINNTPVSSLLPGYLFEMGYGDMESGLWAEMIFNRHFEPFPAYKPGRDWWYGLRERDKEKGMSGLLHTDWREMDWYHSGYDHHYWYAAPGEVDDYHIDENAIFFELENPAGTSRIELLTTDGFSGQYARVTNLSTENGPGIAQNGKYLKRGNSYTFQGHFRYVKGKDRICVSLYPQGRWDRPVASLIISGLKKEWQKRYIQFQQIDYEGYVSIVISPEPGSTVDMDALSFMPDDAVNGWRRDVIEIVRDNIKPGVIRWPGGCYASWYDWRNGIGARDIRPVETSVHWGGFACNDVGTIEYLDFCEKTGAEPFICLNVFHPQKEQYLYYSGDASTNSAHGYQLPEFTQIRKGAKLAAEWVAYCNLAAGEHPMADLRVTHGHEKPYHVKYWELDNEAWRWFRTAEEYANACIAYASVMKAVDPEIQLGICTYGRQLDHGLDTLLQLAGEYIDFLADRALMKEDIDRKIDMIHQYNRSHNQNIRYANTEYFVESFDPVTSDALRKYDIWQGEGRNLVTAAWGYAFSWTNLLMQWQRYGGDIIFTCFNSFANTHLNSVIETPKEGAFLKYPATFGRLFRESPACWLLGFKDYEPDVRKALQIQAAWNRDRTNLVVYLYNAYPVKKTVSIDLNALGRDFGYMKATYIVGPAPESIRSVREPNAMVEGKTVMEEIDLKDGTWVTTVPPGSFVQAELSIHSFSDQ